MAVIPTAGTKTRTDHPITHPYMNRIISLLAVLLFTLSAAAQNKEKNLAKASQLLEKKKYEAAEKHLNKCIEQSPKVAEYYSYRALALLGQGKNDHALQDMGTAIKLEPDSDTYLLQRASYYHAILKYSRSAEDYQSALSLQKNAKDSAYIMALLGLNYRNMGDTTKALNTLEKALQLDSNNDAALSNCALVLTNLGQYDRAIGYLLKIVQLDSTSTLAIQNLGYVYGVKGDYAKAIPWLDKMIRMEPNEAYPYNNRGYAKMKTGDLKGAMADIQKSLKLDPYNAYAYRNLGLLYIEMDDPANACEAFNKALAYHFSEQYGPEVAELKKKYCRKY